MSDNFMAERRRLEAESDARLRRHRIRSIVETIIMVAFSLAVLAGGLWLTAPGGVLGTTPAGDGPRIACDNAVRAVMTSPDIVEITRGDVLVRQLHCGIMNRIDADGRFRPRVEP